MIKAATLKRLNAELIGSQLDEALAPQGFKFLKSKRLLKRQVGIFEQTITIENRLNSIDERLEDAALLLNFNLRVEIMSSAVDKWILKTLGAKTKFRHEIALIEGACPFDLAILDKEDFFTPSESRRFKDEIMASLTDSPKNPRASLDSILDTLHELVREMDELSDPIKIYDARPKAFRNHLRMLVFTENLDPARDHYQQLHTTYVDLIANDSGDDPKTVKQRIVSFEKIIQEAKVLLDLDLENPFSRDVAVKETENQRVLLAKDLGYEECLRLDLSMFDFNSCAINDHGDVVLVTDKSTLIKLDITGQIRAKWEIKFPLGFMGLYDPKVVWLEEVECFVFNNYLIAKDDTLIELKIDIDVSKYRKKPIHADLNDFVYDAENDEFVTLFSIYRGNTTLSRHSRSGELISSQAYEGYGRKINLPREELIFEGEGNSMDIKAFDGTLIENIKYGNGNDRIALSPDGSKMVLHFYSTKSHIHDLNKGQKKVLWAHPTFLKGYVDTFYNDINHNFGLTIASFSPDGKSIIGGGDHGKYVVWDTSTLERKELIPSEETLQSWYPSSSDKSVDQRRFTPYVTEFEGRKLFINRGYDMKKVEFIDHGAYIITQVHDSLLIWNAHHENVGFVEGIVDRMGEVSFSSGKYLSVPRNEKKDLVFFKRAGAIDETFKSSNFQGGKRRSGAMTSIHIPPKEEIAPKAPSKRNSVLAGLSFIARIIRIFR